MHRIVGVGAPGHAGEQLAPDRHRAPHRAQKSLVRHRAQRKKIHHRVLRPDPGNRGNPLQLMNSGKAVMHRVVERRRLAGRPRRVDHLRQRRFLRRQPRNPLQLQPEPLRVPHVLPFVQDRQPAQVLDRPKVVGRQPPLPQHAPVVRMCHRTQAHHPRQLLILPLPQPCPVLPHQTPPAVSTHPSLRRKPQSTPALCPSYPCRETSARAVIPAKAGIHPSSHHPGIRHTPSPRRAGGHRGAGPQPPQHAPPHPALRLIPPLPLGRGPG